MVRQRGNVSRGHCSSGDSEAMVQIGSEAVYQCCQCSDKTMKLSEKGAVGH